MSPVPQGEDNRDKPPDNPDEQLNHLDSPDVVINADSSDSEEENEFGGYMGYQMLAQDVNDCDNESEESDDEDFNENVSGNAEADIGAVDQDLFQQNLTYPDFPDTPNLPGYMKVPDMPRPEKKELLWNQPRHCSLGMDPGHADKIKSVMSGFQLPTSHIPDWATNITEDQWREQVVSRLVGEKSCDNDSQKSASSGSSLNQEVETVGDTHLKTDSSDSHENSEETLTDQSSKSIPEMDASKS